MGRLQFPLTLGGFQTSLEVGKEYLRRTLSTRMMTETEPEVIKKIADRFVEGYSDHGFVIDYPELKSMGLAVEELSGDALAAVWELHRLNRRRHEVEAEQKQAEIDQRIRDLPPDVLDIQPVGRNAGASGEGS